MDCGKRNIGLILMHENQTRKKRGPDKRDSICCSRQARGLDLFAQGSAIWKSEIEASGTGTDGRSLSADTSGRPGSLFLASRHTISRYHTALMPSGLYLPADRLVAEKSHHSYIQLRNSITRGNSDEFRKGNLFPKEESVFNKEVNYLTIYARVRSEFIGMFRRLTEELSSWGYGTDASAGKGQFRIDSNFESADWLDSVSEEPNGCLVLSTFQPSQTDPVDGLRDTFTKYGKLGPDFGLENVFMRPLIMFRPGATFDTPIKNGWLGRALPVDDLISQDTFKTLAERNISICHLAFGLCVTICMDTTTICKKASK